MRPGRINVIAAAVLAPLLAAAGCRPMMGWTASLFVRHKKVPAAYEMPKGKTVLVLVDDYYHVVGYEPIKAEMTERVNKQLRAHRIARRTIEYDRLADLIGTDRRFDELSNAEIAQRLEADLVLYVLVNQFALKDNEAGSLWRGQMQVTVRLVDAQGQLLWPADRFGGYMTPMVYLPVVDDPSPDHAAEVCKALAEEMADRIAKLFYDHKVPLDEPPEQAPESFGE